MSVLFKYPDAPGMAIFWSQIAVVPLALTCCLLVGISSPCKNFISMPMRTKTDVTKVYLREHVHWCCGRIFCVCVPDAWKKFTEQRRDALVFLQ